MNKIEYSIDIVDITKSFKRQTLAGGYTTIKSRLLNFWRSEKTTVNVTTVLKNIRIRIPKGASVGIIGRNGSGKSTLLKLITGIYKPDSGTVSVNGRVAALIELGAGFHPDFTGRENLFLGGILHGLTKAQIEERLPEIVRFAELEKVIDDPVRTYSSGMFMRLGFSLAVHTDPDVLLVDEVLAVGDASFVSKCKDKIAELRKQGKTLLLVTHDLSAVERWCDEAVWIDSGIIKDRGNPRRVIDHYREFVEKGEEAKLIENEFTEQQPTAVTPERWGSREIEITNVVIKNSAGESHLLFHPEDSMQIELEYAQRENVQDLVIGIGINRNDGFPVLGTNTQIDDVQFEIQKTGKIIFSIARLGIADGEYLLDIAAHRSDGYPYDYKKNEIRFIVRSARNRVGILVPEYSWRTNVR